MRRPRFRERTRIFERDVEREVLAHAVDALDEVEILRVRQAARVEPRGVLVADRVDDQRVAFPLAHCVAVPGDRGIGILRHVQRNLPPVLVVFPELVDIVVGLNDLEPHRVQRDARIAVRIRVPQRWIGRIGEILLLAGCRPLGLQLRGRPRCERNFIQRWYPAYVPVTERPHPRAGEIRVRRRRRCGRRLGARGRRQYHGGRRDHEEMPDHAWSSLPSAVIIFMTTPIFAPRSPGWNVTVTTSPAFTVRLDQPLFLMFGGEPSSSNRSVLVPPLVETPSSTCGLVHTNSVTVALMVVSLPMS